MIRTTAVISTAIFSSLLAYKVSVYMNIRYKLLNEKRKKIADLSTIADYKRKLDKEKEDWAKLKFWA
jgi:hypothetical protein